MKEMRITPQNLVQFTQVSHQVIIKIDFRDVILQITCSINEKTLILGGEREREKNQNMT